MSYTDTDLSHEIADLVTQLYDRDQRISANDLTLEVIARHLPEFAQGADFTAHCAWHTTRKAAGNYLARHFKDDTGHLKQRRFPGFEHLQLAYLIGDDNAPVVVPLDQLTSAELDQIAHRLEGEGAAKLKHAKEVRKYRKVRFGARAEAA